MNQKKYLTLRACFRAPKPVARSLFLFVGFTGGRVGRSSGRDFGRGRKHSSQIQSMRLFLTSLLFLRVLFDLSYRNSDQRTPYPSLVDPITAMTATLFFPPKNKKCTLKIKRDSITACGFFFFSRWGGRGVANHIPGSCIKHVRVYIHMYDNTYEYRR